MKAIYKSLIMLAACVGTLTSCSDDNWAPGPDDAAGCMTVFFGQLPSYNIEIEADDSHVISVPVSRANYDLAATVPLKVSETMQGVVIPESVVFEAGQKTAVLNIDVTGTPSKTSGKIVLDIDPKYVGLYGAGGTSLTLNVTMAGAWVPVGEATVYYDDWTWTWTLYPSEKVTIYNLEGTTNFKIQNFVGSGLDFVFTCSDPSGSGYFKPLKNYYTCVEYDSSYSYSETDFYLYNTEEQEWPAAWSVDGSSPLISYYTVYNDDDYSTFDFTDSSAVFQFDGEVDYEDGSYGYLIARYQFKPLFNPFTQNK